MAKSRLNSGLLSLLCPLHKARLIASPHVYFLLFRCNANLKVTFKLRQAVLCLHSENLLSYCLFQIRQSKTFKIICNCFPCDLTGWNHVNCSPCIMPPETRKRLVDGGSQVAASWYELDSVQWATAWADSGFQAGVPTEGEHIWHSH